MINDEKDMQGNLKDSGQSVDSPIKDKAISAPNTKANKLIAALFMVTDIMDKDEPIRAKLRALGMDVISDMYDAPMQAQAKMGQIMSFLDIASTMGMVSSMNAGILKKEFYNFNKSLSEQGGSRWLENFLAPQANSPSNLEITEMYRVENPYQGQKTRLGVQTPKTLLKALSSVSMSNKNRSVQKDTRDNFDMLKKQRRDEVIKVIKESKDAQARGGATISDIRNGAKIYASSLGITALLSCGEKTLQRELVSMVKDNVLKKSGEKRWSKYFL